ncbi:MAG TPA: TonB-dependent receptor [Croceibacterium sp.]|nr:TonB-dependent receptor [Croceibacterium sp.]
MRLKFKALACATVATFVLPGAAWAQDDSAAADKPVDANTIVVTGHGLDATPSVIAYSTITLDRDQLQSTASGRLEDALSNIAGFQQFRRSDSRSTNPTSQGVTLRALGGNASSRALVLLDGVPMLDPFFGHVPLSAMSPNQLEVVRITRGGGSGPFGSGALAGTIELESVDASELGLVSAQGFVNDRGDTESEAAFAPQWKNGFAVVSGRWDRGDGFWTTPESQRVPASVTASYDSWSVGGRVVQAIGPDMQLQVRGLAFEDDRTLRFKGADNHTDGQDLSLRLVGRGDWQFDVIGYAQWRNFSNVVISSTSFAKTLDQHDTPATGIGGKAEIRPPVGGGHTLRLGADYRRSEGDLSEYRFLASGAENGSRFAGGVNSDLGFFIEDDYTLGPILVTGGLRADRWTVEDGYHLNLNAAGDPLDDSEYPDRSGWDASWRVGASVDVARGVRLRGAAYTGLRLPTLNELYRPFVVFPVTTFANANLKNEKLRGYEVGLDVTLSRETQFNLTLFDNKVKNAIANVTPDPVGAPNNRQRQNLDAIDSQGIELGARVGSGPLQFFGTLTYTDSEVEASGVQASLDGNRPAQTPKFAASGTISFEPREDWHFAATLRHIGEQFEGDKEDDPLRAATTLDLFGQVPVVANLSVIGRVENLFDEKIVTRNQGGSIDYGAPQAFWIGVRWGY